jgi:hypothetical protein
MLDLLGILFSSIMMFLVILRAIQLDNLQPWFRPPKAGVDRSGLALRPPASEADGQPARRAVTRHR